ncbi:MAG: nucleotidyltransferase domain-containing protein [Proteobacteria bacterium]|nr:nucleotidyltransferase domain-containing protein [Pseudomonadota bacterium]
MKNKRTADIELDALIKILPSLFKEILKKNLIGVYLTGSYVTDHFNFQTSDLDVAVILHTSLTPNVRKHIGVLHHDLQQKFPKWGRRIECSYITQAMLESMLPPLSARPYVNNGKLYEEDALYGFEWLINLYSLQKNGPL